MKKIFAFILAALMAACSFTACGAEKPAPDTTVADTTASDTTATDVAEDTTVTDEEEKIEDGEEGAFAEKLTVEKVSEQNLSVGIPMTGNGGLYYSKDGKYGIMTFDGKNDTGALWASVKECGKYFAVSDKALGDSLEPEDLNVSGVVDSKGNEILPCEYFMFTALSDRYIKAYKATERTFNEDEAMLYVGSASLFSLGPGEDDPIFKGKWQVYDVVKGAFVEGLEGTKKEVSGMGVQAMGDYLVTYADTSSETIVDSDGKVVDESITVFEDGSTAKLVDNKGVVFSPEGEELFTYELDGYIPTDFFDGYYQASKSDADGKKDYVILNTGGEVILDVSDESSSIPKACGEIIVWNRTAYDLKGNVLLEKVSYQEYLVGAPRWAVLLQNEEKAIVAKYDGTVIATVDITDDIHFEDNLTIFKQGEEGDLYYSHADGDFTLAITAYSDVSPWTAKCKVNNGVYDLIDTYTGEALLENYKEYRYSGLDSDVYYIYAKNVNDEWEIFEIK